jgi:hypothetical protein
MADEMASSTLVLLCTDHQIILSLVNCCLSAREIDCFHALWNETLLQPLYVFIKNRLSWLWRYVTYLCHMFLDPTMCFSFENGIPMLMLVCLVPISHELFRWYCT